MSEDDHSDESLMRFAMKDGLPPGSAMRARFIDQMIRLLEGGISEERIHVLYQKFLRPATVTEFLRIAEEIRVSSAQHKKRKTAVKPKVGEPTN
jgi:mannose/fructose/N-acetylgalactosamine-specific phosphotransferase system component IIB